MKTSQLPTCDGCQAASSPKREPHLRRETLMSSDRSVEAGELSQERSMIRTSGRQEFTRTPVLAKVRTQDGSGAAAPATPAHRCGVASGPTYTPTGSVPVATTGGRKRASFTFAAKFNSDASTGEVPGCCQVRQYIKWDSKFHTWRGGPPHSGFPSGASADTWIEDRDTADKRYGHRSGTHSDPIAGGDEYLLAGVRNQAAGDTYRGSDSPGGPTSMVGKFFFRLDVIDVSNSNAVKASSSTITIDWG